MVEKSAIAEAELFLELSGEYASGCDFESSDDKTNHLATISRVVIDKLDITVEYDVECLQFFHNRYVKS